MVDWTMLCALRGRLAGLCLVGFLLGSGAARALPQQRNLAYPERPGALVVRSDGTVVVSIANNQVLRLTAGPLPPPGASTFNLPLPPAEKLPSPASSSAILLDGGAGTLLVDHGSGASDHANLSRLYFSPGGVETLARHQSIAAFTVDKDYVYFLNLAAPQLRRVRLPPPSGLPKGYNAVERQDPVEPIATLPGHLVDLAVDAGEIFIANATTASLQRLRPPAAPDSLLTFPSAPTKLLLTPEAVFVGLSDGGIYRIDRHGGTAQQLAKLDGEVSALTSAGCFLLVGTTKELAAVETTRGVVRPLAQGVAVSAVAVLGDQILFTSSQQNTLAALARPACPAATEKGGAQPVSAVRPPTRAPSTAKVPTPYQAANGIDGRLDAALHTIRIALPSAGDELAVKQIQRQVTQILATPPTEVWARATDAQVEALQKQGLQVGYRDGVDLMHCFDIRRHPEAPRRPPLAPFHDSSQPSVFLVQLDVPTPALPDFMEQLSSRGLTLLTTEEATLTVRGDRAAVSRLPHLQWLAPYGARERLLNLAAAVLELPPPADDSTRCGWAGGSPATVDRIFRRLGDWVVKAPTAPVKLDAALFRPSPALAALIERLGGKIHQRSDETLTFTVPRQALPELAAHPDLRELGLYAAPSSKSL